MSVLRRAWSRSTKFRVAAGLPGRLRRCSGNLGLGALSSLWSDYQDSEASTYLAIGLPALAGCLVALFAAVRIWRDR